MRQYRLNRISRLKVTTALLATLGTWVLSAWGQSGPAAAASPAVQHAVTASPSQPRPARLAHRARPAPSALAGYVWSSSLTPAGPIVSYYAFSSTGGAGTVNTETPPPLGNYLVEFPGLGAITRPTFDVTPYWTQGTCSVVQVGKIKAGGWEADVRCLSLSGITQNALFDLMIAQPTSQPNGVFDYGAVSVSNRSGALALQYNSSHKTNRVKYLGTGRYQITMPGPATKGTAGTVKVSEFGAGGDCEIADWHGTATGQIIDVRCFASSGARQDNGFFVTYMRRNNLLGLNSTTSAYAYANRPATGRYQPALQYGSHRHATVTIVRYGVGKYQVLLHGSGGPWSTNGGDVQLSTVGTSDHHCRVLSWSQGANPVAYVSCVSNAGAPADSRFTIQWVVA